MKMISENVMNDLRTKFGATISSADAHQYGVQMGMPELYSMMNKELTKVRRGVFSLGGSSVVANIPAIKKESRDEKLARIRDRFETLEILADAVVQRNVCALIVAGAPGVGKTYTLEQKLNLAATQGKIQTVESIKGSISGPGLFMALYANRKAGQVLVLDDVDSVFDDMDALNLLKGALDSSEKRSISWMKDSAFLRVDDIPKTFDYEGSIVFISNCDFETQIEKGGKMAPHLSALMSRSVFMDLCIHTNEDILVRVEQVLRETSMGQKLGLTETQMIDCMDFLSSNIAGLRDLSLRSVIKLAGFIKTTSDWKKLARVTMLKKGF